ncbi:MAG: CidA/LrgA family protein [Eubacteriales bacterium]|nr:CidA/LrgA family protein [Eubacteriales bacterium]
MKALRQLALLLLFVFLGDFLNRGLGVPLPGNILGLILLLGALLTGLVKLDHVEGVAQFLLSHMTVLFVPAGVGLLAILGVIQGNWLILVLIALVTTILVLALTGLIVQKLRRRV